LVDAAVAGADIDGRALLIHCQRLRRRRAGGRRGERRVGARDRDRKQRPDVRRGGRPGAAGAGAAAGRKLPLLLRGGGGGGGGDGGDAPAAEEAVVAAAEQDGRGRSCEFEMVAMMKRYV
jgi:hypothetical protein